MPDYSSPDFSILGDLPNVYNKARLASEREQSLKAIGEAFQGNTPANLKQLGGRMIAAGDVANGLQFIKMADEREAMETANSQFATMYGVNRPGATPGAQTTPPPPPATTQKPVQASNKVWGDDEAVNAGLYPPVTTVAKGYQPNVPGAVPLPVPRPPGAGPAAAPPVVDAPQAPDADPGKAPTMPIPGAVPPVSAALVPPPQQQTPPFITPPPDSPPPVAATPPKQVPPPISVRAGSAESNQRIGSLSIMANNPRLPAATRDIYKLMLQEEFKKSELTPEEKQYVNYYYQTQATGGVPVPLNDFIINQKRATATPEAEKEESKITGKGAGERANEMFKAAGAAPKTLGNLARVEFLLKNLEQGKVSPTKTTISAWAKSLGLPDDTAEKLGLDPKAVGDAQALAALTNESVVSKIGAGGFPANNFSDADREFLLATVPKLANDPRANKIMIEVGRRLAHDDIQTAKDYQAWQKKPENVGKNLSFRDFEVAYAGYKASKDRYGDLARETAALIGEPATQPPPGRTPPPPKRGAATGVVPAELSGAPDEAKLNAAPENSIINLGGQRFQKQGGQWKAL